MEIKTYLRFVIPISFILLSVGGILFSPQKSEALSVKATSNYVGTLFYRWTGTGGVWTGGYGHGLTNPNAQVNYTATVIDLDTNLTISPGDSVSVGTQIEFIPGREKPSFTGTGQSFDTPGGVWRTNATHPDYRGTITDLAGTPRSLGYCSNDYFIGHSRNSSYANYDVYIPLSVHPAPMTVDVSGSTAGLVSLGGNRYRIDSSGTITAVFNFDATYGRYYYEYLNPVEIYYVGGRWVSSPARCYTSWGAFPMIRVDTGIQKSVYTTAAPYVVSFPLNHAFKTSSNANNYVYDVNFEAKSRDYVFTVVSTAPPGKSAPEPPIFQGTGTATTGEDYIFSFKSIDDDGDDLYYEIDVNDDGVWDQRMPAGTITEDTWQVDNPRQWPTSGTRIIKVRAVDTDLAKSAWADHEVVVSAPAATALLELSPDGGTTWTVTDMTAVDTNTNVQIKWTGTNATTCTGDANFNTGTDITGTVPVTTPVAPGATIFNLTCDGPGGTATDMITLTSTADPSPVVTLESSTDGSAWDLAPHTETIQSGGEFHLRWSAINADTCSIVGEPLIYTNAENLNPPPGVPFSGLKTYSVRCWQSPDTSVVDEKTIILNVLAPPTVDLTITDSIPGAPNGPVTINTGDTVSLDWNSSPDTTGCTATDGDGFSTSGNTSGSDTVTPPVGINQYTIECVGPGGTSLPDTVEIEVLSLPNLEPIALNPTATNFNNATGVYEAVSFNYAIQNTGNTSVTEQFRSRATFINAEDGSETSIDLSYIQADVTPLNPADQLSLTGLTISGISMPVGYAHQLKIEIDQENDIPEDDENDNERTEYIGNTPPPDPADPPVVVPPDPGVQLWIDDELVKYENTTVLNWDTVATYPMHCQVSGPSFTTVTFDPSQPLPNGDPDDSEITGPIVAKNTYTLRCDVPDPADPNAANPTAGLTLPPIATFTDTAVVEAIGQLEEI